MATQSSYGGGDQDSPEAFLADRQRTWNAFTSATVWSVVFMVVLLVAMAIFLL